MGPGTLVLVVALIWIGMVLGLFRVLAQMERVEREVMPPDVQGRPTQGSRRG
jgi:hypothetical protein